MGRPSNTAQRRAQIIDAMLDVLARHGYDGATTTAIAAAAGLAPGLVHYHFGSKHEILLALLHSLREHLDARFQHRLASCDDSARGRLLAFVDAHVERGPDADARVVAAWVVIAAEAVKNAEVRALYRTAAHERLETLHALLHAALVDAGRGTTSAHDGAAALLSAIEGSFLLAGAAPALLPDGYAAPMLHRMIDGLLGPAPSPSSSSASSSSSA